MSEELLRRNVNPSRRTGRAFRYFFMFLAVVGTFAVAVDRADALCSASLGSPSAGASVSFPQTFSWSTSGTCSGLAIAFATSSNPTNVYYFYTSGTSISIDASQWANATAYLGTASTYYWTIGE